MESQRKLSMAKEYIIACDLRWQMVTHYSTEDLTGSVLISWVLVIKGTVTSKCGIKLIDGY